MTTLAYFALEFLVVSLFLIGLFRLRGRLGMHGVVMGLASLQMLQTMLGSGVYWDVGGGMLASPGSSVLFASNLAMLLVAYAFGGTRDARAALYAVLGANVIIATFGGVLALHMHHVPPTVEDVPAHVFADGIKSTIVGICTLYLDQLVALLAFAELQRRFPRLPHWIRFTAVLTGALALDTIVFMTAMFVGTDEYVSLVTAGLITKSVAGLVFGVTWGLLLRPRRMIAGDTMKEVMAGLLFLDDPERLRQLALKDSLTGLYNRRYYEMVFESLVDAVDPTSGYTFSVLVIDVDRFKSVNDSIGHAGGDEVLCSIAATISRAIRDEDMAFRLGGDEFVVLLPDTDQRGARAVAERIRSGSIGHPRLEAPVTLTMGAAVFPEDGSARDALFEVADRRLYEGKEAGRDRLVV